MTSSEGKPNDNESNNTDLEPKLTDAERYRLLRKIDFHILPFVSLLYLLSFLWVTFFFLLPPFKFPQSCRHSDRANIGYFAFMLYSVTDADIDLNHKVMRESPAWPGMST
jgi:hypothetical protein